MSTEERTYIVYGTATVSVTAHVEAEALRSAKVLPEALALVAQADAAKGSPRHAWEAFYPTTRGWADKCLRCGTVYDPALSTARKPECVATATWRKEYPEDDGGTK